MATPKRRDVLPRRRRHDDEGEEDGSTVGDVAEYASSEGSLITDADDAGDLSSNSGDEDNAHSTTLSPVLTKQSTATKATKKAKSFPTTIDTEAIMGGLKIRDGENVEELHFDEAEEDTSSNKPSEQRSKSQPTQPKNQRVSSQTPTQPRRGYFLHDDRSRARSGTSSPAVRGRSRGFAGSSNRGNFGSFVNETSKQWTHDLHETVNQPPPLLTPAQPAQSAQPAAPSAQRVATVPTLPNRSFSTTTILGNVPVSISLPDAERRESKVMVKKHYTLLPQHRPPLRRDKPVRISIPDMHPRYIFPSSERSFIFIPRAMRPNQQQFRGRGRGSYHGSRRTSMYGGSVYTPSIGMSRRPSIAASNAGSGTQTPGMPIPQYPMAMGVGMGMGIATQKPVVRLPASGMQPQPFVPAMHNMDVVMRDNPAIIHTPSTTLPMHQPIPQKTLSVADIESPAQQAQHPQPFHQQIPAHMPEQKMPHIPEGAVYAQPFQPYPVPPQAAYYGMQYPVPMMMQPQYQMNMSMGGPVIEHMQQHTLAATNGGQPPQQGSLAHESNGMVYYYDPNQQQYPSMMMNMASNAHFYPPVQQQMFYQ